MAIQIGLGLSTDKDTIQAVKQAAQQAKINLSKGKIKLALVFTSVEFAHPHTIKMISGLLETTDIIGCSSAAIISNQGIFKRGILIALLSFSEDIHCNIACAQEIKTKTALSAGEELGEKLLQGSGGMRRDLSVIFSDGLMDEGSNLIYGLEEKLGSSFPLVGACASDDLSFAKTYLYFKQGVFNDASCGMLWGGKLNFGLGIKHGWKPLGKPRTITKSKGNIVYEIDNAPARNIYEDYFSYDLINLKKELKRISIFYPIGIYLSGEEEYLLRNIVSIQKDGSLIFQGNIPEGSPMRLMIGTKESCLAATQQALDEAKKSLANSIIDPKRKETINFVLVFDSISRYMLLGREASKELEIIKKGLGPDVPIIGIYTYGEQAPLRALNYRGKAYFHNQTISILAVGG